MNTNMIIRFGLLDDEYVPTCADARNGLAIVQLGEEFKDSGWFSLTHVPTGHALGNPMPDYHIAALFRDAIDAAFPNVNWERVSVEDVSELGDYQPAARGLVVRFTGDDAS